MQNGAEFFATSIRWIAQIGSIASGALLLAFVFGEGVTPALLTAGEWVALALFPGGVILGMMIGWRHEGWGGTITLVSIFAFYTLEFALSGALPQGPYFWPLPCRACSLASAGGSMANRSTTRIRRRQPG